MNEIPKLFITGALGRAVYMSVSDFHKSDDKKIESDEMFFELGGDGLIRATTAKRLGAVTTLFSFLPEGSHNISALAQKEGFTLMPIVRGGYKPLFKTVITDKYNDVRETVYNGSGDKIDRYAVLEAEEAIRFCNGLILDNTVSDDAIYMALEIAKRGDAKTLLIPSADFSLDSEILSKAYVTMFDTKSASALLGIKSGCQMSEVAFALMRKGIKRAIVLSGHTATLFENDELTTLKMSPPSTIVAAGLMDVFAAAFMVYTCRGYDARISLKAATCAVSVSNEKEGILDNIPYKEQIKL